jgi:hypothetical protein
LAYWESAAQLASANHLSEGSCNNTSIIRTILNYIENSTGMILKTELRFANGPKEENVLFTDESSFKSNGHVNRHNMHYWSPVHPHWMRQEKIQNRWSLNVWGGIINNRLIGPFFFDQNLTGEIYAHFLKMSWITESNSKHVVSAR